MTTRRKDRSSEYGTVPDRVARLLLDEPPAGRGEFAWCLLQHRSRLRALWEAHGAAIVTIWARRHPGTRPPLWWKAAAPVPRLLADGQPPRYPKAPGLYEGQAAYLDRLGLLQRGERARIPAAAWLPEDIRR
ncbi:MAG TPA: hypothetical protein VJ673_23555 [Aromatoleum sp.]|uniref:hypothetical protein n=1 Tax=Aromatoleum sp. TaxID=2307007 RepID=UPI002B490154|nr:hypothetical protein [Aromatoleum sp.]HJV28676.1 hypothetical protein [Aromatoleum sp.]